MAALLLHSVEEFDEVIFELLERARPRSVLEIGAETGAFSERLLARCDGIGARFTSIDPHPPEHLMRRAQSSTTFDLVVGLSLPYLRKHGCEHDFVLIDGDHNYFTVSNELELVHASWATHATDGTIVLHDLGLPSARRAHSGLLRAVDAFLKSHPEYVYRAIDAVFGLGALARRGTKAAETAENVLGRYDNARVRRLERNRLELYPKVIELEAALAARGAEGAPEKKDLS